LPFARLVQARGRPDGAHAEAVAEPRGRRRRDDRDLGQQIALPEPAVAVRVERAGHVVGIDKRLIDTTVEFPAVAEAGPQVSAQGRHPLLGVPVPGIGQPLVALANLEQVPRPG
jgi:hypothetical protein